MALPDYIPVRTVGFRGVLELEQGKGLSAKVAVRSSVSLRWASTGELFQALGGTFSSGRGASVTFPLPVTDDDGWLTTANEIIDVSSEGAYTHTYTATVVVRDASGQQVGDTYEYGPFTVPTSVSTLWLDELEQQTTVAGLAVARPTVYSVNGQDGAVTITAAGIGAYQKPGTGVPKTDLASAVQTSLGLADGAAQKAQNLNDVADKAAARTNLDVFSKAEANAAIAEKVSTDAGDPETEIGLVFADYTLNSDPRLGDTRTPVDESVTLAKLAAQVRELMYSGLALDGEETLPRASASTNVSLSSGQLRLSFFRARRDATITSLGVVTGGTAASGTPTLRRIALYEFDEAAFHAASGNVLLRIGRTADMSSAFTSANTEYTASLESNVDIEAGRMYGIGVIVVSGSTMPNFTGNPTMGGSAAHAYRFPPVCAVAGTFTDAPETLAYSALNASTQNIRMFAL